MNTNVGSSGKSEDHQNSEESSLRRLVVVLTLELIKRMEEEERANLQAHTTAAESGLNDVAVQGYPTDQPPKHQGFFDIEFVIGVLAENSIKCCLVQEPALNYYGSTRLMWDYVLCVPDEKLDAAEAVFTNRSFLEPFKPLSMISMSYLDHFFPRFKFVGIALFFVLMPAKAFHIDCGEETIEHSATGLPYPRLPVYAASLIDNHNMGDLEEVVD
jgi:hypothetical protein